MKRRDIHQRRAYAARRLSLAVDRIIVAASKPDRDKVKLWANVWARRAGMLK